MQSLDLYKDREHSIIKIGDKDYKIPKEYTVEEVERSLELKAEGEKIENEEVDTENNNEKEEKLIKFWDNAFSQVSILFQRYQPETTVEELKKLLTHNDVLSILGFFDKHRPKAINEEVKKKAKN